MAGLMDGLGEQYGTPLMRRPGASFHEPTWEPYQHMNSTDPLAATRMSMDMVRALGYGNPLGLIPGAIAATSDIRGAFNPQYQERVTGQTRQWLRDAQRQDNSGDAQNQTGGFYGRRR